MRLYEPFKSEAQRLVTITCDWKGCGREIYRAPGQAYCEAAYGLHYPRVKFDLCEEHLAEVARFFEANATPTVHKTTTEAHSDAPAA